MSPAAGLRPHWQQFFGPDSMPVMTHDTPPDKPSQHDQPRLPHLVIGTAAVWAGAAILVLAACETLGGGSIGLPGLWYVNRTIWIGLGLLLIPAGIAIQAWRPPQPKRWKASRPGRRFHRVRVYSRDGCHLCDEAVELLWDFRYGAYLPTAEVVDISADPELEAKFKTQIPVVEFDGRIRFRGRINEVLLRRLIEGTPPLRDD